jgi:hypothetical protein
MTTVNKALVDDTVVAALKQVLPMFDAFSMRFEKDGLNSGDSVYVPLAVDPTVGTKTLGTMQTATGSITGKIITFANPTAAGWDAIEGNIGGALFEKYWADKIAGAVYGVAKAVVDAALAVVTKANYGDTADDKVVCAPGDFNQKRLAELWEKAETKKLGRQRSLGMNAAFASGLLGESGLALILATSGASFIQSGVVPPLMGMNSWAYAGFPANSEALGGAIFDKSAIAAAVAPVKMILGAGQGNIIDRFMVTEPNSGLTAMYTQTGDGGGTVSGEVAILYGVAKCNNAVVRLVNG